MLHHNRLPPITESVYLSRVESRLLHSFPHEALALYVCACARRSQESIRFGSEHSAGERATEAIYSKWPSLMSNVAEAPLQRPRGII